MVRQLSFILISVVLFSLLPATAAAIDKADTSALGDQATASSDLPDLSQPLTDATVASMMHSYHQLVEGLLRSARNAQTRPADPIIANDGCSEMP